MFDEEQGPERIDTKGVKGGRGGDLGRGFLWVGENARYEVGQVKVVRVQRKSLLDLGSRGGDGRFI